MEIEAVLIDWAGTVTVPMREMMMTAVAKANVSKEILTKAFGSFQDYVGGGDSLFHQAERGEIGDDELLDHFNTVAPGSGVLFDIQSPASFLHAPDRPEMITFLEELVNEDITVFLATNNFQSAQELLASRYLDTGLVAAIVNSALVGARKPEDAYFALCLDALDCAGPNVLLLDDQAPNLAAAKGFGIQTILVEDNAEPAIQQARQLLGLVG